MERSVPSPNGGERTPIPPPTGRRESGLARPVCAGALGAGLLASVAFASGAFAAATGSDEVGVRSALHASAAHQIPAFSRRYGTSCSTCHVTPGKLNAQGEAFRLNGYRLPEDDDDLREDDPVPLGGDPWKDLWPEAIWPGEISGALPLALHVVNDVRVARRDSDGRLTAMYQFPETVHLLVGTTLGGGIAAFLDVGWDRDEGLHVAEAKVKLQDILPWLPERTLNLWLGAQRLHLLTFGDASLDRAARARFSWERSSLADWEFEQPGTDRTLASEGRFHLGAARPAVELNGLLGGRLYYGVGAAQPSVVDGGGGAHVSDVYVKVRYKLRGLRLDGTAPDGFEPGAWGGQFLDQGVTLEHFAYRGETPLEHGGPDRHRTFGAALRVARGRSDLGVGQVWGRNSQPWGVPDVGARRSSTFVRAEYLLYPWLIGSLKADRTRIRVTSSDPGYAEVPPLRRARLLPGLVVLLRPNVRVVTEGELFLRQETRTQNGTGRPHALWVRLDVAF